MNRNQIFHTLTRTTSFALLTFGTLAALVAMATDASAGLIVNSVRFDARVRSSGGDGPVAGVEQHFTNVPFDEDDNLEPLPAINANLPSPLDDASDLRVELNESGGAELNGDDYVDAVFWITSAMGILVNNDLDTLINPPEGNIEFETYVYLPAGNDNEDEDDEDQLLGIDEKLFIGGIRYEDGPCASCVPTFVSVSNNRGSFDDPIHIVVELNGEDILNFLKLHVYWTTMDRPTIPEPSTGLLMLLGLAGATGVARRRRG